MLSKAIIAAITLVGLAAAAPLSSYDPCPTICQDGVNDCGESWGGCWDICKSEESPTPPPCTATYTPTIPTITSDPPITLPVITPDPTITLSIITPDPTITLPIITGDGEFTTAVPTPRLED
ncbi:hypothetical protein FGSG_05609 [Fusarium graminearum PH-1]|uniref:Chromosome 3, complete genome n=1 Tax=Gibberella zeae (strain ATCC MYA-4620 / CBS 123657 / FGSC 9075 / NRRL 31084 / PH-1) TaxID=229533 RepID=I1RNM6_GIBZE|nr:hypothetical protein FGSG_05609 [Fusarium graminearum PH-1]ESU11593.1 hypothetical protein FGSG_05609 [Fusarium graminearum PH-1]CAF3577988.1 unnamed protein product [Fusarium graminearum]CEF86117.1 unnamed protein product [Fusarium graminearum]|eukprot:XP_011324169.1 hypothetical protein FGSG_05609 [Fusarium graminearum PH-1]